MAGAALRLGAYLGRPSLFVDEAMVAINVGDRSFRELLTPLDYDQSAPVPFLWVVKLCTTVAGMNEFTLRAVPLLAGLGLLYLVWHVAARLLPAPAAVLAVWVAATAPTLVQFSVMTKPYMTDALVALLVLAPTLSVLERPGDGAAWRHLTLWGFAGVLWSFPAAFLLAAAGAGLLASPAVRREPRALLRLSVAAAVWGGTFLALYVTLYRSAATTPYVQQFWAANYLTPAALVPGGGGWSMLGQALLQVLVNRPTPPPTILLFTVVALAGTLFLAARHGASVLLPMIGPLAALILASALHRYPVSARLLLFLAPAVVLTLAAALAAAGERWPVGTRAVVARSLAAALPLTFAAVALSHPFRTPRTRLAARELERLASSGEPVYVINSAIPHWVFYTTDWSAPDTAYLRVVNELTDVEGPAFHNSPSRGRPVGAEEGAGLVLRRGGRLEVFGLPPGMRRIQVSGGTRVEQASPDSGWAVREAERIRGVAQPVVWLFVAGTFAGFEDDLLASLRRAGGVPDVQVASGGTEIYRFRFTSPTAHPE